MSFTSHKINYEKITCAILERKLDSYPARSLCAVRNNLLLINKTNDYCFLIEKTGEYWHRSCLKYFYKAETKGLVLIRRYDHRTRIVISFA